MAAMPAPDRSEPSASPSLTGALGTGWETLKQRFWLLIVAVLIYGAIEVASNVFTVPVGPGGPQQPVSVIGPLWSILVTGPLLVGLAWLALRAVRGLEPELDDLFEGFRHYPDAVGGMLVYGLAVTVGLILLVVPGLIAMVRLAFTPYLIVDRELGPIEAVKASWEATRGHGWSLFGLLVVSVFILVGGLLLLVVGLIPATAWVATSWAAYYDVVGAPADRAQRPPSRVDPDPT